MCVTNHHPGKSMWMLRVPQTTLFKSLRVACWKVVGFSSRNYFHQVINLISQIWDNMKIKEIRLRSRNSLSIHLWFMLNKLVTLFAFILLQSRFLNSYGSIWHVRRSLSTVRWNKSRKNLWGFGKWWFFLLNGSKILRLRQNKEDRCQPCRKFNTLLFIRRSSMEAGFTHSRNFLLFSPQ
jgi:hypothetical protein